MPSTARDYVHIILIYNVFFFFTIAVLELMFMRTTTSKLQWLHPHPLFVCVA